MKIILISIFIVIIMLIVGIYFPMARDIIFIAYMIFLLILFLKIAYTKTEDD